MGEALHYASKEYERLLVGRDAHIRELGADLAHYRKQAFDLLDKANAQQAEIERLREAISDDLEDARSVCGGDGHGCEAYREYDWPDERKHRKCGQCPMDALSTCREALEGNGDG